MDSVIYISSSDAGGGVRVERQGRNPILDSTTHAPFPMDLNCTSPEAAQQLAWLLLYDCLQNDRRADRLQASFAELLIWPLVQRKNWTLTSDEVEAAAESIELTEGWFWLGAGYYADQEPNVSENLSAHTIPMGDA